MSLIWSLQALLTRHEAYVADSEQERSTLSSMIERLEVDKRATETSNARLLEENQSLLNQLTELNTSFADSDAHIKSLNVTLRSTQQDLHRLSVLASRTVQLEMQLDAMECEHADLQQAAMTAREQERVTSRRWKSAERTLQGLQEEVERIHMEATQERESHVELLASLQQSQTFKLEMKNTAETIPFKGQPNTQGADILPNFVRDIIDDNTRLQSSMAELRDMLLSSHEETEGLRDELMLQPRSITGHDSDLQPASLAEELGRVSPGAGIRAFHVHHHYHNAQHARDGSEARQLRIKHGDATVELSAASAGAPWQTRTSVRTPRHPTTALTAISAEASIGVTPNYQVPPSRSSVRSWAFSNTQSSSRRLLALESNTNDSALGSSTPTSPECGNATSPTPSFSSPDTFTKSSIRLLRNTPMYRSRSAVSRSGQETLHLMTGMAHIHEDITEHLDLAATRIEDDRGTATQNLRAVHETGSIAIGRRPSLRRPASHESFLSISGMDLRTLRSQPSRLMVTRNGFLPNTTLGTSSASAALVSKKPVLGSMARASCPNVIRRDGDRSTCGSTCDGDVRPGSSSGMAERSSLASSIRYKDSLSRKLGTWAWGKWRLGSTPFISHLPGKTTASLPRLRQLGGSQLESPQQGSLLPAPIRVVAADLDEILLRETLLE